MLVASSTPVRAQDDTVGLHTTLAGWADDALLAILDRDAARGGRLSERGILQRFWSDIDPDYQINLMRMRFDLVDDDEWYRHTSGARYWSGSVNTRDEAIGAEFKARAPLGGRWAADVNLRHQSLLELARSLVRLRVRRTVRSGSRGRISCSSRAIPSKPPFCLGAKRMPGCGECASSTRTEGDRKSVV